MWKKFQKLAKLNLDDLLLYIGVECGLFLLIQIIIGCVMHFARPDTSITVSCIIFPIVGGFTALVAGISHVGISFDQALRFGQTRKRALGLTLGLCAFESAFALALAGLLAAVERFLCPPLWAKLAGLNGWRFGIPMPVPEPDAAVPTRNPLLMVETFALDWYWWLLIFALAVGGGVIVGAVIQRFGGKGGWIIWCICFGPMILMQIFPREIVSAAELVVPVLAVLFVGGFLWSIWSLLHAVVRS